jgi:hypothetical protein
MSWRKRGKIGLCMSRTSTELLEPVDSFCTTARGKMLAH